MSAAGLVPGLRAVRPSAAAADAVVVYVLYRRASRTARGGDLGERAAEGNGAGQPQRDHPRGDVAGAVLLWIVGDHWMDGSIVAFLAISFMLVLGVFTWGDMARNHRPGPHRHAGHPGDHGRGLARVASSPGSPIFAAHHVGGLSPTATIMALTTITSSRTTCSPASRRTPRDVPDHAGRRLALPGLPARELVMRCADHRSWRDQPVCDRAGAGLLQQRLHQAGRVLGPGFVLARCSCRPCCSSAFRS